MFSWSLISAIIVGSWLHTENNSKTCDYQPLRILLQLVSLWKKKTKKQSWKHFCLYKIGYRFSKRKHLNILYSYNIISMFCNIWMFHVCLIKWVYHALIIIIKKTACPIAHNRFTGAYIYFFNFCTLMAVRDVVICE